MHSCKCYMRYITSTGLYKTIPMAHASESRASNPGFQKWLILYSFNSHQDPLGYCRTDVSILAWTCWALRKVELGTMGCINGSADPSSDITIISVCMWIFGTKFLFKARPVLLQANVLDWYDHGCWCLHNWPSGRKTKGEVGIEI